MKAITMILLSVFLGKSCSNEAQNDIANTTLQYTATTRGFFQKIIVINQKATVFRDRNSEKNPEQITISDKDWKEIIGYFEKIDLEKVPTLKDPTQKRFYDGAAIANLKIRYQDKNYETTDFDHEFPPAEIEKLVNKIVSLGKAKE
ncbi:hypothetical protein [Flavobacterium sp.]|uniref:hypothetical protein n=1 Tax=Flavobacterium sp. TaxID=239 RepID=UPI0025F219C5|nr:hypothetical protein [Flavobacterium sp.]